MSRRTIVLALVALALGVALLASRYLPADLGWEEPAAAAARPAQPERKLQPSVADRLARIDARLRLAPDRRAIAAIGDIRRLVHGGDSAEAEVVYASGSWKVRYGGQSVGTLSSFPRFSALLSLLDEWAAKQRREAGAIELAPDPAIRPELQSRLNRFDDAAAFEVLDGVDAAWREGRASVGDLIAASEALAQLCALLPDDLPSADDLAARAFASLALARQYDPARALRAEVQLAFAMGYTNHAHGLAQNLPTNDPLAAFVRKDAPALERLAKASKTGDGDFLYGAHVARSRPVEEWVDWYQNLPRERALRPAIARTGLSTRSVPTGHVLPELYTALLLNRFGAPLPEGTRPEVVLTRCDALTRTVEARAGKLGGPFADAALYADVYRGACLSAVYRKLLFYVESFNHPDSALELARSLPKDASEAMAALRDWAELSAGTSRDAAALSEAASRLPLGMSQRAELVRRALAALQAHDPRRADVADAAVAWLDSRTSGRSFGAELADDAYRDPGLEERLNAAVLDVEGVERPGLTARVAAFRRDWDALWSIAESDANTLEQRVSALGSLEGQEPIESERIRRGYARLLAKHGDSEWMRRHFANFLEKKLGERRAARETLLPILEANPEQSLPTDTVAGVISRLYLEDGDAKSAWKIVEPRLANMTVHSPALRAQLALGDLRRAEELARENAERYPHSLHVAADLAQVLWTQRRHVEAAQLIANFPVAASDNERCWNFCRAFVRTFKGKPASEVEPAFRELVAAKLDYQLLQGTIDTYRQNAEAETAFVLGQAMKLPDAILQLQTECYKSLKMARGEDEALRWLASKLSPSDYAVAAKLFYFREADELLWKLIEDPDRHGGSATWLLRAAAFVREKQPDPAHRAALVAYFGAHKTTPDEQLGAALAGLLDAETLLESARSESDLARAAYYLGARAEGARDFRGAMRMYQLALSSPANNGRGLAQEAVMRIGRLDTSLDALAAAGAPGEVVAAKP